MKSKINKMKGNEKGKRKDITLAIAQYSHNLTTALFNKKQ
jgi:hypothetical protein